MAPSRPSRPRDTNQLAKRVIDIATGDVAEGEPTRDESPAAQLGRIGGLKGGRARADALTPELRREIA